MYLPCIHENLGLMTSISQEWQPTLIVLAIRDGGGLEIQGHLWLVSERDRSIITNAILLRLERKMGLVPHI